MSPELVSALAAEFAALAVQTTTPAQPTPLDVMTAPQVAEYLQLPLSVILEETNWGRLPGKQIAGEWRYLRIALLEWMRTSERPSVKSDTVGNLQSTTEVEREIAALSTARRALGTVGDWFPDEGEE